MNEEDNIPPGFRKLIERWSYRIAVWVIVGFVFIIMAFVLAGIVEDRETGQLGWLRGTRRMVRPGIVSGTDFIVTNRLILIDHRGDEVVLFNDEGTIYLMNANGTTAFKTGGR